jgi:hypothetical protein
MRRRKRRRQQQDKNKNKGEKKRGEEKMEAQGGGGGGGGLVARLQELSMADDEKEASPSSPTTTTTTTSDTAPAAAEAVTEEQDIIPPPSPPPTAPPTPLLSLEEYLLQHAPDANICPISHCLFQQPVVAMDGHTYSRSEIEAWFATCAKIGQPVTSPKTNALMEPLVVPNHNVRAHVDEYIERITKEWEEMMKKEEEGKEG